MFYTEGFLELHRASSPVQLCQEKTGRVTPRANKFLRKALIESSWVAARNDPALSLAFNKLCERMKPNEAIIRIAKKILNRIRFVMKNKTKYVPCVVS